MIFPVVLISACFLIPASLGYEESCYLSEEQEDQCASVCYPIVKPLLRYFEKSNEKDVQLLKCKTDYSEVQKRYSELGLEKYDQISKCQKDHSDLERRHSEVLSKLKDIEVKYERLLSKQQESENLNALINQKNKEIELLKEQNRDLKKTHELATLTNQFRENIDKLEDIVKNGGMNTNNGTKSTNKTKKVKVNTGGVLTTPLPSISNPITPKTEIIDLPDPCSRNQKEFKALHEIQLPGSDPFKVVCVSNLYYGSGWLIVYNKDSSQIFNRTYEDYERGFGNVGTEGEVEFFIGLKRLHLLLNANPHNVLLHTFDGYRLCDNFVLGDRSEGYKVKTIGSCTRSGTSIPKQGSKFSTFDRDEDGVPGRNLAKDLGYGWWFDPTMSNIRYFSPQFDYIYMYIRRTD